ncbi:hypothetical protein P4O66_020686 [Electrophorus voltai]|uniref:Ig-like domain-containing protein n=1 Tax=Electrophorus voltai TaxID=2609070 RepID=A0AAD9DLH0_9TELE|nr:hypothetical protein P4O66_020686 [Electrophorus voltai]
MDHSTVIMKTLLFLMFTIHLGLADNSTLHHVCNAVTPRTDFSECTAAVLVDGKWIKNITANDPLLDYKKTTQIQQRIQEIFKDNEATGMGPFIQAQGVHTVQVMYGCELQDNGTKRGYMQYSYDGEDYISLNLNTHTWTAANDKAENTKQKWDSDVVYSVGQTNYLENTCIEWLQKYAERKVSPEVTLLQKDSSSPVVCHAKGFFPREVKISWKKNGKDLNENMELTETLPNHDGTFQKRSILTVSPEELDKNEYTCVVHHSGLEKDLVLRMADRRVLNTGRRNLTLKGKKCCKSLHSKLLNCTHH